MKIRFVVLLGIGLVACSSSKSGTNQAMVSNSMANDSTSGSTSTGPVVPVVPVEEDGGVPLLGQAVVQVTGIQTALPSLPALTNVVAIERDDSVGIDFDPFDGAVDYRVYPLPADSDITEGSNGVITVANAIYRCAGLRQGYDLPNSNDADASSLVPPLGPFSWQDQISSQPILGYVYPDAASDRQPVYAVAGYTQGEEFGWREARLKIYTTDPNERATLLGQGWRDDGIVFYVPSAASSNTTTIYSSQTAMSYGTGPTMVYYVQSYFTSADMASHASDTTPPAPAFQVLTAAADDAVALYGSFYKPGDNHTELSVGPERYKRATTQGDGPLWHLEWSGLTQPTTLVVEALSTGCPYPGLLAAQHLDAPPHQPFLTLSDMQMASSTGEVFINGEWDPPGYIVTNMQVDAGPSRFQTGSTPPQAIARSFVNVAPQPHDPNAWDFYDGFSQGLGTLTEIPSCMEDGALGYNCDHWQSSTYDISAYRLDEPMGVEVITFGETLGELWTAFDDSGQDVTGKIRVTPMQMANVDSDPTKFLHATMSVNIVSTDRRYPQLIISDQPAPVQEGLDNPSSNTLLIQSIMGPSMRIEAQAIHGLVNGSPWDVNNQAPNHVFIDYVPALSGSMLIPTEPPFEHAGVDRMTRFDVYVSSQRTYLFFDGTPAGCMTYPSGFALSGAVSVTIGDVLYHEGAQDELICYQNDPYPFLQAHECTETVRHFDDLGFKSGVPAPTWDDTTLPCQSY